MKTSLIFENQQRKNIERKITQLLNSGFDTSKIKEPWAIGNYLIENCNEVLGDFYTECSLSFARRAMADLAFMDKDDFYYIVDVKTHRLDTKFNMPNLTSVERLARFYEDDKNYFVVLKVNYKVRGSKIIIEKATFIPIEFLSWDCLTIGALGWGQIQIANANIVNVIPKNKRRKWMIKMCDLLLEFYPKEIDKIKERIAHFEKIKKYWQKKKD